jgi:hypothetical protein
MNVKVESSEYSTIARMRREGHSLRSIGDRYGVTRERIRQIVADNYPEVPKEMAHYREEQSRWKRVCPECGGPKAPASKQCKQCLISQTTKWTPDAIVEAMQEYQRRYGKTPSCTEWNPSLARWRNLPATADRFYADGCWPHVQTVLQRFGSWRAAVDAAGLAPNRVGRPPK